MSSKKKCSLEGHLGPQMIHCMRFIRKVAVAFNCQSTIVPISSGSNVISVVLCSEVQCAYDSITVKVDMTN